MVLCNKITVSTFIASSGENFLGGKKIKEFEEKFSEKIGTKFAVAFNSASSALHAAVVAVGIRPGEEGIVPPTRHSFLCQRGAHRASCQFLEICPRDFGQ